MKSTLYICLALTACAQAYWLMGIEDFITTERLDPVVNPGKVSGHVHSVLGGSNFRFNTNTAALRQSECTSIPIPEDKSNYWFPHMYFQWNNGSFTSLNGGAVICVSDYLFNDKPGTTTAFPDDFRMISGDPTLRTYDSNSFAQQAVTFLCLDFNGVSTRYNSLPAKACPSGIRAQINFPSCWDGKNLDSPDHKSHVAFLSGGPDSGTCSDPKYPVTLPRIFIEVYWASNDFEKMKPQAMNPSQPFVFAQGDPTGYGYHADFINGWDKGVLQNAVDKCHCNPYGDPTCCVDQGIFHMNKGQNCRITKSINEQTTGTLPKLPGNNPVQVEGRRATVFPDTSNPQLISPVYAYTGDSPIQVGTILPGGSSPTATPVTPVTSSIPTATPVTPVTSSIPTVPSSSVPLPAASSSNTPGSSSSPSSPAVTTSHQTTPVTSSTSPILSVPYSSVPHPVASSSGTPRPISSSSPSSSPSSSVVATSHQTSSAQATSTQIPTVPSTSTTFAHTIPASSSRGIFPTFSLPTFSFPPIAAPTLSKPAAPYNYNPGAHVPNGHHMATPPKNDHPASSHQCRRHSKRRVSIEKHDEVVLSRDEAVLPRDETVKVDNVTPVFGARKLTRFSHHRRFTNRLI